MPGKRRAIGSTATAWEQEIPAAGHELADHTLHHRGARTDAEAEAEIGQCADRIRQVAPGQGRLVQFLGGGGTNWMMRKPWTYFDAKYDLTSAAGGRSLGCTESYPWFSPPAFARELDNAIQNGNWLIPYFHNIGSGGLAITEQAFREVIQTVAARREEVWCAGMSRVQRYQTERDRAHLSAYAASDDTVVLRLVCTTDAALYDQPLSLELTLPGKTDVTVAKADGSAVDFTVCQEGQSRRVIFAVAPVDGVYEVRDTGLGSCLACEARTGHRRTGQSSLPVLHQRRSAALRAKREQPLAREIWNQLQNRAAARSSGVGRRSPTIRTRPGSGPATRQRTCGRWPSPMS